MLRTQQNFIKSVLKLKISWNNIKRLYGLAISFILWYILAIFLKGVIPYPHQVFFSFVKLFQTELIVHIYYSLKRLIIGLFIAVVLGVHIGLFIGLSKKGEQLISPIIYTLYPIPKAALLPVLIILFGIYDLTKVILIILIVIFPIIVNIKDAIKSIPNEIFYVAKTLSLTKWQMYKDIIIPAIMPSLLTSVRIGIGTSIAVLYLSETFATFKGLGYYIALNISINNLKMFTGIFTLSIIGYCLFLIVDILENKLCKWK